MIQGAIFDLDGLLIDTQRIYQSTLKDIEKKYGILLTDYFVKNIPPFKIKMYQLLSV